MLVAVVAIVLIWTVSYTPNDNDPIAFTFLLQGRSKPLETLEGGAKVLGSSLYLKSRGFWVRRTHWTGLCILNCGTTLHGGVGKGRLYFPFLSWQGSRNALSGKVCQLQWSPTLRPPVYATTLLVWPYSFNPNEKSLSHFIILKTLLMRPPRYYDKDFMA